MNPLLASQNSGFRRSIFTPYTGYWITMLPSRFPGVGGLKDFVDNRGKTVQNNEMWNFTLLVDAILSASAWLDY